MAETWYWKHDNNNNNNNDKSSTQQKNKSKNNSKWIYYILSDNSMIILCKIQNQNSLFYKSRTNLSVTPKNTCHSKISRKQIYEQQQNTTMVTSFKCTKFNEWSAIS